MGRKRKYDIKGIQVGHRIELTGIQKKFSWQYLNNFNKREEGIFKHVKEDDKIFIERVS